MVKSGLDNSTAMSMGGWLAESFAVESAVDDSVVALRGGLLKEEVSNFFGYIRGKTHGGNMLLKRWWYWSML